MRNQIFTIIALGASAWLFASNVDAKGEPGSGTADSSAIPCACNPDEAITVAAGYTVGAYMPGYSDGSQACSDFNPDSGAGCEAGIAGCDFAGSFDITDSNNNTVTYYIILDVVSTVPVFDLACGDGPLSGSVSDSNGVKVATVTTQCSKCEI